MFVFALGSVGVVVDHTEGIAGLFMGQFQDSGHKLMVITYHMLGCSRLVGRRRRRSPAGHILGRRTAGNYHHNPDRHSIVAVAVAVGRIVRSRCRPGHLV